MSDDQTGRIYAISGAITEDGISGRFVTDNGRMFLLQGIAGTNGDVTATVSALARPQAVFRDGSFKTSGTLTATVVEQTRILAEWSLDSGDAGTLTLLYDDRYERGSDIARLVGTWEASYGIVYNIDAMGEIFGQADNGCAYVGEVEIIDPDYNVYRVFIDDFCLAARSSGLGILTDHTGTDDAFVWMLNMEIGWFIADTLLKK